MIVDIHTHLWDHPDRLGPYLGTPISRRLTQKPWERLNLSTASLLRASECVDKVIIHGFYSQLLQVDIPSPLIASYVKTGGTRFIGFAGVDPMASDLRDRLTQAIDLGLQGLTISPSAQGFHPQHSQAMWLYQWACKHQMPLVVDAASYPTPLANMEFGQPHLWDEVGREFPDLRLVIGQVGHPWVDSTLALLSKHEHFYADISSVASRPWQLYQVLQAAHQQEVIDKLMFGSGYPFDTPQEVITRIYHINGLVRDTLMPSIPRQALQDLVERDALGCLGLQDTSTKNKSNTSTSSPHDEPDAEVQRVYPADAILVTTDRKPTTPPPEQQEPAHQSVVPTTQTQKPDEPTPSSL